MAISTTEFKQLTVKHYRLYDIQIRLLRFRIIQMVE